MKFLPAVFVVATACLNNLSAQTPSGLVGSWNVVSTPTNDHNMENHANIGTSAYVWIISGYPGGKFSVSVQGETAFPRLLGVWNQRESTLILNGKNINIGGNSVVWFKLRLNDKGELVGLKRYLGPGPEFMDFTIVAKKQ